MSYYPHHAGHECELAHMRLHKEDRQSIASKLVAGIPFDDVLDNIHLNAGALQPTDLHLLSKKDLHNIERDFGIDSGEVRHRNDADSVAAWIEHTKLDSKTQHFVRYVKFQGESVSVECDIDHVPASVSDISESEAVLGLLSCTQSDNYERHIAAAHVPWSHINATMQSHPALAKVAAEHLVRLQSLLTVLQTKPDLPRLPAVSNEHEPSNKRAAKQRHFMSTRRAKRTKQQLTASKPSRQEKEFLLQALDGDVPVISSQPPAVNTVNFEHLYV